MDKRDGLLSMPEAVARLTASMPVIFPTDTVWGVGVKWQSEKAVTALYETKQRQDANPMAILVQELDQLQDLRLDFEAMSPQSHAGMLRLIKEFWPGGLTIVLPWKHKPAFYRWPYNNVGVRIPNHPITQELIRQAGPLLQSSANVSGGLAPASFEAIDPEFIALTGGVVAGESGGEAASTVVDLSGEEPNIVRAGCVPVAEIERVLRN